MQTPFERRENNIDFLRLALAILVLYSHCYPLSGAGAAEPFERLDLYQQSGGGIAVDLFFILSGFLITASYERSRSVWDYLLKRVRRIYPAFILAMLISAVCILPISGGHMTEVTPLGRCRDFITQTLQLRESHYAGTFIRNPVSLAVNGSIWSVSYEFWCYLGLLLLGITGLLRSRIFLLISFAALTVGSVLFTFPSTQTYFDTLYRYSWMFFLDRTIGYLPMWFRVLPLYIAGILFYRLRMHLSTRPAWIAIACATLIAASQLRHCLPLVFPIAGGYLILVLAFHPRIRMHGWARFGDLSYGTYLYAFPIQQLIMQHIGHTVSPWRLLILSLPPTLLCAIASWHIIERWALTPRRTS